ncbi:uncharacterized protein BO87DRAFT_448759 [Aspergillus neoniger CBS 115656]|uniref:Uncharacterized protein n=1 Tax=Aspergillus neoniger (strain CBS 115656) TaxID=1448310 RepID=A0A318Y533_ASPNB|nr:hypothetical protein BO87DRAFT_448759 [Aspergillus neoniger CBS 115656]PYH29345.1 hypothetical protein BO87DRAFT_448759 [Aspergillus neoniger CBS 115656]
MVEQKPQRVLVIVSNGSILGTILVFFRGDIPNSCRGIRNINFFVGFIPPHT